MKSLIQEISKIDTHKCGLLNVFEIETFDEAKFLKAISNTNFKISENKTGKLSYVKQSDIHTIDNSKTSYFFDYHTDGLYRKQIPPIGILICKNPGKKIANTSFIDTHNILNYFSETELNIIRKLAIVYIDKDGNSYEKSILNKHPYSGKTHLVYGSRIYLKPKSNLQIKQIPTIREINEIGAKLNYLTLSVSKVEFNWTKNLVVIFDNLRFLHSRINNISETDKQRELIRIWLKDN